MSKVVVLAELPSRPGTGDECVAASSQMSPVVEPVAGKGPEL